ncbi:MAG: hypothetical protein EOS27_14235 [Mesorhizobium sp.]|nr:MAG: hypothetical protein EOS27_14235 [Mesorhizobium sp.]
MDDRGADYAREPFCCLQTQRNAEVTHVPMGIDRLLKKFVDTLKEYKFSGAMLYETPRSLQEQRWLSQSLGGNIRWHFHDQFGNGDVHNEFLPTFYIALGGAGWKQTTVHRVAGGTNKDI